MPTQATDTTDSDSRPVERVVLEAAALGQEDLPSRILVTPWGEIESSAGPFVVDDEAARETIAAFARHGTDLPVDYEHQTLGGPYSSPSGQAPAAGWIKALTAVSPEQAGDGQSPGEPGLWADVEWTDEAKEKLRSRQYRYLSPVALVRRGDRRLVAIHSVALTNKPAIVGMRPVVGSDASVSPADQAPSSPAGELRELLEVDQTAADEVVLVAAAERIRTLQRAEALRQASDRVGKAMTAGKLGAAQRDWALSLALRDPAEFDRWEAAAPVLVPLGRMSPPRPAAAAKTATGDRAVEAAARTEYRANRQVLEPLCTEEAYVASALRESRS